MLINLLCSVAKYTVESIFLPRSSQERKLKIPAGRYSWKDIVATIEKIQGVKYTCNIHPRQVAIDGQKRCAEKGDVDGELAWSLKSLLGDTNAVAVPEPWDNDKFSFKPMTLEEAVVKFFKDLGTENDRLARDFPVPAEA